MEVILDNQVQIYFGRGGCMYKSAIIYYPTDPKILGEIQREIAVFHCAAAVKYMDNIGLDDRQKIMVVDELLNEMAARQSSTA